MWNRWINTYALLIFSFTLTVPRSFETVLYGGSLLIVNSGLLGRSGWTSTVTTVTPPTSLFLYKHYPFNISTVMFVSVILLSAFSIVASSPITSSRKFKVAVIGGGPSGACAAEALARNPVCFRRTLTLNFHLTGPFLLLFTEYRMRFIWTKNG